MLIAPSKTNCLNSERIDRTIRAQRLPVVSLPAIASPLAEKSGEKHFDQERELHRQNQVDQTPVVLTLGAHQREFSAHLYYLTAHFHNLEIFASTPSILAMILASNISILVLSFSSNAARSAVEAQHVDSA